MAVAVQESMTSVDLVTEAVLDVYQSRIEDAAEMTLAEVVGSPVQAGATRAVVVGEDHMVEIVLDDEADPESLIDVAWTLSGKRWSTNVLVPLGRLGDAHMALRGTPSTLQGWWLEDDVVHFAGYERP